MLGCFVVGFVYEIRNLLSSISGLVEMVCEVWQFDLEDCKLFLFVLGEVDRLNDFVSIMLEVGKLWMFDLIGVDLCVLVSEVMKVVWLGVFGWVEVIVLVDLVCVYVDLD